MNPDLFHVYKTGRMTVIGFDAKHLEDPLHAASVQDQLLEMVKTHSCEILVVDLMNVSIVSSWILGVLAAIKRNGIDIELYHPSNELKEVLDVTHLDKLLHVRGNASAE